MLVVFSYVLAVVSWTVLEKPFLKLKRFFNWKPVARPSSNAPSMQVHASDRVGEAAFCHGKRDL
jgi:peptidoglycan/LPS O-acetylase OafA/YrhL